MSKAQNFAWGRITKVSGCAIVSALISSKYGQLLGASSDSITALISIIAIFAAVLIAVITIVGDPNMLVPGNWKYSYETARTIQSKLARFSHLFTVYSITLIFLVLSQLIRENSIDILFFAHNITAFFSAWSLLMSIFLPYSLMKIQKEKLEELIKVKQEKKPKKH